MTREELRVMEIRIGQELFEIEALASPTLPADIEYFVPAYSAGMLLAEPLTEKLRDLGWLVILKWMPEGHPFVIDEETNRTTRTPCACELNWMGKNNDRHWIMRHLWALADTMPEALVKAAVLAIDAMKIAKVPPFEERADESK